MLVRQGENRPKRSRLKRKSTKRYDRPVPGDRVQMDTCKIRPGLYQYTAIDDCSRWQVLALGGFKWSLQHLDGGVCDGHAETAFGSVGAGRLALARPARGGAA